MTERKILKGKLIHIEGNKVVIKDAEGNEAALECTENVMKWMDRFEVGDQVHATSYGDPEKITFLGKDNGTTAQTPKPTPKQKPETTGKEEGWVILQGKKYATLKVLLNKAHELYPGRFSIHTNMIERDAKEHLCIFEATVQIVNDKGDIITSYTGIGDTNNSNIDKMIQPSYIRMAETRAVVRALRFATNIAEASFEELPTRDEEANQKEVEHKAKKEKIKAEAREKDFRCS